MRFKIGNLSVWFVLASLAFGCSTQLNAAILGPGDFIKLNRVGAYGGAQGGGEFSIWKWTGLDTNGADTWQDLHLQTFCLEFNEHIRIDEKLLVGAVSNRAVSGGVGGQDALGSIGPIEQRTKFLYESFVNQSISLPSSGPQFNYSSNTWSNALQEAIWFLEKEISTPRSTLPSATQLLLDFADSYYSTTTTYPVFVLNLFAANTTLTNFNPEVSSTWPHSNASIVRISCFTIQVNCPLLRLRPCLNLIQVRCG